MLRRGGSDVTAARRRAKRRMRNLDDEKKLPLLKGGRAFLNRIRGMGGAEPPPHSDLLDERPEHNVELDDEALLRLYESLGPSPDGDPGFREEQQTPPTGAELLIRLRKDPGLLPDVYRR